MHHTTLICVSPGDKIAHIKRHYLHRPQKVEPNDMEIHYGSKIISSLIIKQCCKRLEVPILLESAKAPLQSSLQADTSGTSPAPYICPKVVSTQAQECKLQSHLHRNLTQEDHKFKACLGANVSSRVVSAT